MLRLLVTLLLLSVAFGYTHNVDQLIRELSDDIKNTTADTFLRGTTPFSTHFRQSLEQEPGARRFNAEAHRRICASEALRRAYQRPEFPVLQKVLAQPRDITELNRDLLLRGAILTKRIWKHGLEWPKKTRLVQVPESLFEEIEAGTLTAESCCLSYADKSRKEKGCFSCLSVIQLSRPDQQPNPLLRTDIPGDNKPALQMTAPNDAEGREFLTELPHFATAVSGALIDSIVDVARVAIDRALNQTAPLFPEWERTIYQAMLVKVDAKWPGDVGRTVRQSALATLWLRHIVPKIVLVPCDPSEMKFTSLLAALYQFAGNGILKPSYTVLLCRRSFVDPFQSQWVPAVKKLTRLFLGNGIE